MAGLRKVLVCTPDAEFYAELSQNEASKKYALLSMNETIGLVQKVYDEMPHLVILDIRSSDVAAFDMCGQMKYDIILCHIPVILLTDASPLGNKIDCGADLYLYKPILFDELFYHVDRIIAQTIDELDINPLTHLPGNRSSVQRMEASLAAKKPFALCCLDLKNLHVYNEAYGVHRGDFLIRETANIIREVIAGDGSPDAFIGHLGGDDFVILAAPAAASALAEKIIEFFDKSVHRFYEKIDRERGYMVIRAADGKFNHHSFVSLSIAIITNEFIPYADVAEMAKTASQIQRYLKRFPASAYLRDRRSDVRQPLSPLDLPPTVVRKYQTGQVRKEGGMPAQHAEIIEAVAHFLKTGDFETYVQPIVNMKDRVVHGYEALSRFRKGGGQFWDPAAIFHAAREANLIKEFDVMCAKKALATNRGLPAYQKLFINLNRETLIDAACLSDILAVSSIGLDQIVIELTEQSLLSEIDQVLVAFEELRVRGIHFAIDDMGGGQVSLRETANLRPHYIKFDRSLIRDIDKQENKQKILFSLLVFARGINARVTAEGIETKAEMDYLEKSGIDYGQGFYIARPQKLNFQPA